MRHSNGWAFANFQINLGSVDFFGGIVDRMELPEEQIDALKDVLNVKDQPGLEALLQNLPLDDRRKKFCAPCRI